MVNKQFATQLIKQLVKEQGFDYCGISKADFLIDQAPRLESWLKAQKNGQLHWMENHFEKRLDPRKLLPGTKSVVSVLLNYFPEKQQDKDTYLVAKYAYGRDYHKVIKKKLNIVLKQLKEQIGDVNARVFVDSAPVMDKVWAEKSGLGWIGKNTNLINKKSGSFFLIGEILIDLDLLYDQPIKDYCGTCRRCIDACPTNAIEENYSMNASACISYFTIELKDAIDTKYQWNDWVFGCDICQDVCPWNRLSKPTKEPDFNAKKGVHFNKNEWEEMTDIIFEEAFKGSPLKRAGFEGIKKNIVHLKKNDGLES